MKKERNNLFLNIFEIENGIPPFYESIRFIGNNETFYESNISDYQNGSIDSTKYITHIPDYLQTNYKNEDKLHIIRFFLEKGYAINISKFQDVESYIRSQYKNKAKTIRRFVNRLESCFDIKYMFFYGEISKEDYTYLLAVLRKMIVQRFRQRNEQSKSLLHWERTVERTLPLVLSRKASIFVIYDRDKPIEIAINYHFKQIMFSYISSYDIDYSKFGLGHVEIYKQLEWCIENNFTRFEMGWGNLDYKRRWSNDLYDFEQHLIYNKKSFTAKYKAIIQEIFIHVKMYLISKNVHVWFRKIKNGLTSTKKTLYRKYEINPVELIPNEINLTKIEFENEEYSFLRKIIYDFLYSEVDHISKIKVYEVDKNNIYFIQGSKNIIKVVFIN